MPPDPQGIPKGSQSQVWEEVQHQGPAQTGVGVRMLHTGLKPATSPPSWGAEPRGEAAESGCVSVKGSRDCLQWNARHVRTGT